MRHRLAASLLAILVLALAAFAGTSLAGNGHGNHGGGDHGQWGSGQQQSQSQPSHSQSRSTHDSWSNHGSSSKQSDTSQSSPATGGDNSQGVKPSNSTRHDTYAKGSSNQTKQYGNGKTAGQIATHAGYGNATLHGPGNSQPHKTACAGHEVDVHALKSHGSKCGAAEQQSAQQSVQHSAKKPCPKKHGVSQETQGVEAAQVERKHQSTEHAVSTHTKKPCPKKHGVEARQVEHKQKVEEQKVEQKPAPAPAPVVVQVTQSKSVSTWAHEHVVICHATGSSTNPYVRISPSAAGVYHGHLGHQGGRDIVPPFIWNGQTFSENWDSNGQAIWNAGCAVPAPAPAAATQAPAAPSTPAPAATPAPAPAATQAQAVTVTTTPAPAPAPAVVPSATVTTTNAPAVPAPAVGGVKGATATLAPKAKPQGGVLGATTRLGSSVAGTRLPFTGLPLWIFTAVAAGLILVGVGVRRSARDRA
jgi:hypothetical protein